MQDRITFEKATHKDWQIILELEKSELDNSIYKPITDIEELKKYFFKSVVYKVFQSGKLVGYCGYELRDEEAEVTALLVLEQYRKRGLGATMLSKLLTDLTSVKRIKVITSPKNSVALRLYLKHGFIIEKWLDNYWQGEPRLVLYKTN